MADPQPNNSSNGELVPSETSAQPVAEGDNVATTPAAGAEGEQQPPAAGFSMMGMLKGLLLRGIIIYMVTSFFKKPPANQEGTGTTISAVPSSNIWANGTFFDLYVFISEDDKGNAHFKDPRSLVWKQEDMMYGDWGSGPEYDGVHYYNATITPTKSMINNGTIFIHVYAVLSGKSPDPSKPNYNADDIIYRSKQLNRYRKKIYKKTVNLITGTTEQSLEDQIKADNETVEIISHWHPNITVNIVDDHTAWVQGRVPKPIDEFVEFHEITGKYYPIMYVNDYWNLVRDYYPINDTLKELPLHLTFQPLSLFKWQLYVAQGMRNSWMSGIMGQSLADEQLEDQDAMKEALLETSPYLLGLTAFVSLLHSLFEFLAFKNDIQFWKERKSLEGLSVRSVFFNVFQSLIVLLYIFDNDANTLIKFSVAIGLAIECWKVKKVVNIKVDREQRSCLGILPFKIVFEDKGTYVESSTKQYDMIAFKYLSWLFFPLVVCYSIYSLMYQEHKGWYSWSISTVYGFLLTFGFIMMTPQLFINYKMKSVAHLPWRMLSYKFLNTIIDDIFAFVIKMPMMYRLGCFRDDVVFLVYVYQRWIYRVDPNRYNEFGTSKNDEKGVGQGDEDEKIEDTPSSSSSEQARIKQD